MAGSEFLRRRVFAIAFGSAVLAFASSVDAGAPPVSLGEVSTRVAKADPSIERAFRGAVEEELGSLDLSGVRARDHYVLSASLLEITTRASEGGSESTAVVSATLRRAKGGALHAILRGRARASDRPSEARSVELSALRGAVKSALGRVPEALK